MKKGTVGGVERFKARLDHLTEEREETRSFENRRPGISTLNVQCPMFKGYERIRRGQKKNGQGNSACAALTRLSVSQCLTEKSKIVGNRVATN